MSHSTCNVIATQSGNPTKKHPRATQLVLELFARLEGGNILMQFPDGQKFRLGGVGPTVHMYIRDERVFGETLAQGDIGFAQTWMAADWDCDDLTGLLTLLARNRAVLSEAMHGRKLRLIGHWLMHKLRSNTRSGSKRNIEAHYDLGNDFYKLWLDDTMTYSSAIFHTPYESLQDAQKRKYRRVLQQMDAKPGQRILEIGCGWGGFAEVATLEFGCTVTGVTLSPSQLAFAEARAERGGWSSRAKFMLCDYRDLGGQFDHIASIEMIEAVGERFWPSYYAQLAARLKPGGRCVVQAITVADSLFARYRRGTDFIQRYIFPGGMLPCPASVSQQASKAGLRIVDDFAFGTDYARTLQHWHRTFMAEQSEVRGQGFDERFTRMWRFYLAYCEAGFLAGDIDVHQYTFAHVATKSEAAFQLAP